MNGYWKKHRHITNLITNTTNTCCNASNYIAGTAKDISKQKDTAFMNYDSSSEESFESNEESSDIGRVDSANGEVYPSYNDSNSLKDILLITIGGGSRDLLVHPGLTSSQYSDIHTMSTCIPNVWLTTDHLSAVWCLQQVIVINRFLYSIIQTNTRQRHYGNQFIADKSVRLAKARHYFTVS